MQGRGQDGRFPLLPNAFAAKSRDGNIEPTPLGEAYFALDAAFERLETTLDLYAEKMTEAETLVRRVRQTRFDLDFICTQAEKNYVYWLERRGRGMFLRASPIDVSTLLQEKLFNKVETVVMTSATLSTNGKFDFIKDRLGLDNGKTDTLLAPSSFDYQKQAIIYLPKAMPEPSSPEFSQMAAGEIIKLIEYHKRTRFCALHEQLFDERALRTSFDARKFPVFRAGFDVKSGLLEQFKKTPSAVLFATSSVSGKALTCAATNFPAS